MWTYNQAVRPPAPFINVLLNHPEIPSRTANIQAKIDTAADVSAIPATLVTQLELPIAKKLIVRGYDNVPTTMFAYSIHVEVAQVRFKSLRVITTPRTYVLLGRDILNHLYIHLHGPNLTFDISLTPI